MKICKLPTASDFILVHSHTTLFSGASWAPKHWVLRVQPKIQGHWATGPPFTNTELPPEGLWQYIRSWWYWLNPFREILSSGFRNVSCKQKIDGGSYWAEQNDLFNFGRSITREHFCEIIVDLDQRFRWRLKTFLIHISDSSCSVDWNHWRNFGRVYLEDKFCEIILNLDLWFWCHFKSSDNPFVHWSQIVYAIL